MLAGLAGHDPGGLHRPPQSNRASEPRRAVARESAPHRPSAGPIHLSTLDVRRRALLDRHARAEPRDRKSTRLNSSHGYISYAVFCLKKKKKQQENSQSKHYDTKL